LTAQKGVVTYSHKQMGKIEDVMKKRRVFILIIVWVILSIVHLSIAADYKYVGSAKSKKYHYPGCKWALKIHPDHLVTFKSAKEALDSGYAPCKVCKPPTKD
jgi:hypothetical protein